MDYKEQPKVSVMIPCYNAKEFIVECLESILSQDYNDLELIVSDDCSTDGTQQILRRYAKDNRIKLFLNDRNIGITDNCNQALMACSGDFISLFAGDDVMLPSKISNQVKVMSRDQNLVMTYHPVEIFDSESGETLFVTNKTAGEDVSSVKDILLKGGIPGGCSIMVRKSAIPEGGYDRRLNTVSDWLFQLEIALCGNVKKVDGTFSRYRKHSGGSSQESLQLLDESLESLDLLVLKHPNRKELVELTSRAKARYLAGEAVRQISANKALAVMLSKRALTFDNGRAKYKVLVLVTWLNDHVFGLNVLIPFIINKLKYSLKRVFG